MSFEKDLKKFVPKYQELLKEYADFFNSRLNDSFPGIANNFEDSRFSWNKFIEEQKNPLKEKREYFLNKFQSLFLPQDYKSLERNASNPGYEFVGLDLLIDNMDFDFGKLIFRYRHEALMSWAQTLTTFPGSILEDKIRFYFEPKVLDLKKTNSKLDKQQRYIHETNYGEIETIDVDNFIFSFLPKNAQKYSKIKPKRNALILGANKTQELYFINELQFNVNDIGTGDIDAFWNHVGFVK